MRQAGLLGDAFGGFLIHARGRAQDAAADVGAAGQLEHALYRPVLAHRAVQDGKYAVAALQRGEQLPRIDGARARAQAAYGRASFVKILGKGGQQALRGDFHPGAVGADVDEASLKTADIEMGEHAARGHQRDQAFGRSPSAEDQYGRSAHW